MHNYHPAQLNVGRTLAPLSVRHQPASEAKNVIINAPV